MAKTLDKPSLYDTDYVAWLEDQVAHLRARRLSALDVEKVAEELESLMRKERRQLRNRLEVLIAHLFEVGSSANTALQSLARECRRAAGANSETATRQPVLETVGG
jgi:hypothetical protein